MSGPTYGPELQAVLDGLQARRVSLERKWEGFFGPRDSVRAVQEQQRLLHELRATLDGMVDSCRTMQTKAQAAFAPPALQAEIAGHMNYFAAKRDEIGQRMGRE